jgi:peptidoglycan/xylan/chitin deacetylase (PgdA/CDA1 family)
MNHTILNIHGVGAVPRQIDDDERDCWIEKSFLEGLLDIVRDHAQVRLTVDDGNVSDFDIILPELIKRGLTATFFICSGRLGHPTFLGEEHVRGLLAKGMAIGSHGVAHIPWRHLPEAQLREELEDSRKMLEKICGTRIDAAACPFGAYDKVSLNSLRRAGYRYVYTSDGGTVDLKEWLQPRITVTCLMTLGDIRRLVQRGSGAWKQSLIEMKKFIKRHR